MDETTAWDEIGLALLALETSASRMRAAWYERDRARYQAQRDSLTRQAGNLNTMGDRLDDIAALESDDA